MKYLGLVLLFMMVFGRYFIVRARGNRLAHWWKKGQTAFDRSDWVGAEAAFRECVRIEPIAAPARRMLGATLIRRNKQAEAEEHLRAAAQLEPRNMGAHLDLGFFLASCTPPRVEEAIDAFAKAVASSAQARGILTGEKRLAPEITSHARFRALL